MWSNMSAASLSPGEPFCSYSLAGFLCAKGFFSFTMEPESLAPAPPSGPPTLAPGPASVAFLRLKIAIASGCLTLGSGNVGVMLICCAAPDTG